MEQLDMQKAQRVWQRVQNTEARQPDLAPMVLRLREAEAICTRLEKAAPGHRTLLHSAQTQLRRQAACVCGIHFLCTGDRLSRNTPSLKQESAEALLRHLVGNCLRLGRQYREHVNDAEYGGVFAALEIQMQNLCLSLLEILGAGA